MVPAENQPAIGGAELSRVPQKIKIGWGGYRPGAGRPRKRPLHHPPHLIPASLGTRWYVVEVQHHQDAAVAAELHALGIPHLCLQRLIPERPARRRSDGLRPLPPVPAHLVPIFPRYVFAAFDTADPAWRVIATTRGVVRLLGQTPERPTPIPDAAIERLQAQADERGVILPPAPPPVLEPVQKGAAVRYAGLNGICRWSSRRRVGLDLETGMRVQVPRELVEIV